MPLTGLRNRIEAFIAEREEELLRVDLARRRRPQLGRLYSDHGDLFSIARIAEIQRILAGITGVEERRVRTLLDFVARGRALRDAGELLDELLGWEISGSVPVEDSRIPLRQVSTALSLASEPEDRHRIEREYLAVLDDELHLVADFLARHREGIEELGYGTYVDSFQILGGIDLRAMVRDGERFLDDTRALYEELLSWHLPKLAGVSIDEATAADGWRLNAAVEYDSLLLGGEQLRRVIGSVAETGLDPLAEGRLEIEWDARLGTTAGSVCHAPRIPAQVRVTVSTRSGRPAVESFLGAYGLGLHQAYTDPTLPTEQRYLGDDSVPEASGALLSSLLRNSEFLRRLFGFSRERAAEYVRLELLNLLLELRGDVARLRYELAYYQEGAGPELFAELLTDATRLKHDPRAALWSIDLEFGRARRLRAMQLGAVHADVLRNRYDEDWFRNPAAGGYLRDLFSQGRRYTATELAVQLSSQPLGFDALSGHL